MVVQLVPTRKLVVPIEQAMVLFVRFPRSFFSSKPFSLLLTDHSHTHKRVSLSTRGKISKMSDLCRVSC
jgi:hypothetical protein